jgi:hypothetical protein
MRLNLELMAMRWLWIEKKCPYIVRERTPRYGIGQPDVIGVTASRFITEIEIKRSVSDFRADAKKHCRRNRDLYPQLIPKQFYYLAPADVADKILPQIPDWAGLMKPSENCWDAVVVKNAPVNKASQRLSIKECIKLARNMVNHMMSLEDARQQLVFRFIDGHNPYWENNPNGGHFQI